MAHARPDLSPLSVVLAWTWFTHLRFLTHANPGHSVFGFLSVAGIRSFRRIRSAGTIAPSHPLYLRNFSADPLLPSLSPGEHVSRISRVLRGRSCRAPGRCRRHLCRRRVSLEAHRGGRARALAY